MKPIIATLTALCLVATLGCVNRQEPEPIAAVPPPLPIPAEGNSLEPVDVRRPAPASDLTAQSGPIVPPRAAPEPIPAEPAQRTYTIRKGDNLWKIAKDVYGDGQRWVDIRDANPGLNPKKMAIGQEIILPD